MAILSHTFLLAISFHEFIGEKTNVVAIGIFVCSYSSFVTVNPPPPIVSLIYGAKE
jgi:hypothetical protein